MHLTKKYTKVLFVSSAIASFGLVASSHAQGESSTTTKSDTTTLAFGGDPRQHEVISSDRSVKVPEAITTSPSTSQPEFLRHKGNHKETIQKQTTTKKVIVNEARPIRENYPHHNHPNHKVTTKTTTRTTHPEAITTSPSTISNTPITEPYEKPVVVPTTPTTTAPIVPAVPTIEKTDSNNTTNYSNGSYFIEDKDKAISTSPNSVKETTNTTIYPAPQNTDTDLHPSNINNDMPEAITTTPSTISSDIKTKAIEGKNDIKEAADKLKDKTIELKDNIENHMTGSSYNSDSVFDNN